MTDVYLFLFYWFYKQDKFQIKFRLLQLNHNILPSEPYGYHQKQWNSVEGVEALLILNKDEFSDRFYRMI